MRGTTVQTAQAQAAQAAQDAAREAAQAAGQAAGQAALAAQDASQAQIQVDAERLAEQISEQVTRDVERAMEQGNVSTEQGGRRVIELPDGRRIIVNGSSVRFENVPTLGVPNDLARQGMKTGIAMASIIGGTLVAIIVLLPLARAFARWIDRRATAPSLPPEVLTRLSNIENAVESVAVEVERISEGQRFTTRLLNERAAERISERVG